MNSHRKTECQQVNEALSAHFDGVANDAEQQLATAHLAQCSSCAQMWREWHSLRLMEQRAIGPVTSGEMLPLAPVKAPRHLKAAILRQTVSPPIWQRFWPRLLTGMAVPTAAVACWLLVVAAPWQQSMPEISPTLNTVPENYATTIPQTSASSPPKETHENLTEIIPDKPGKTTPLKVTKSTIEKESKISRSGRQSKSPAKSTFKPTPSSDNSSFESLKAKSPQISMASLERPNSQVALPIPPKAVEPVITVAPKPRATEPVLVAELTEQDLAEDVSDPIVEYITANDVRPDDIRLAVENYRAALLDDGSDL